MEFRIARVTIALAFVLSSLVACGHLKEQVPVAVDDMPGEMLTNIRQDLLATAPEGPRAG